MAATFLHTADWQLGKPFAGAPDPAKRALLQQERLNAIERIRERAVEHGAAFVVIAGDCFDSPTPTNATVSAACSAIGRFGIPVFAIPGNHDHGGPGSVWEQEFFRREQEKLAPNLRVLLEPEPVETEHAVLFPCPLLRRAESADPAAWLRALEPGALGRFGEKPRIVLAHGSVQGFEARVDGEDEEARFANQIDLAHLPAGRFDYVALGDWHGTKEISPTAWYSGTPELDRFPKGGSNEPGHVLAVTAWRGGPPRIGRVATARLGWHSLAWEFHGEDGLGALEQKIGEMIGSRAGEDLLRLELSGPLGIGAATGLEGFLESLEARLLRLKLIDRTTVAPSPEEVEALTRRAEDPLISRVAARLVEAAGAEGPQAEIARAALRELHAACLARQP